MVIKSKKSKPKLVRSGVTNSSVAKIEYLPPGAESPEDVVITHHLLDVLDDKGKPEVMKQQEAAKLDGNAPLRAIVGAIRNRDVTNDEIEEGLELDSLQGQKCRVLIEHRRGPGGKPTAVIAAVLPAEAGDEK